MEKVIRGSIILTFSNLGVRFLGYLYRILMGRFLTPYEFGMLNLALPLQYMAVIFASSGIAPSVAKFVAQGRGTGVVYSSLFYYTLLGSAVGGFFYLLAGPIATGVFQEPEVAELIKISSLAFPLGLATACVTGGFQGYGRFWYMGGTLVSQQAFRILLAVLLVLLGYGALGGILGSTLGFLLALLPAFYMLRSLPRGSFSVKPGEFKEVFFFSLPVSLTSLAAFILAYVDVLLIGYYLSPEEAGVYSAASPTARLLLAFSSGLYAALLPSISELKARGETLEIRSYVSKAYRISLGVLLPGTLLSLYFADSIIGLLFPGEGYSGAAGPFRILVVGTVFLGIFTVNAGVFQGLGAPKTPMKILAVAALIDLLLNIALIPVLGVEGAAYATALSFAFAGVASTINLKAKFYMGTTF